MKRLVVAASLLCLALHVNAADERDASKIAKKYSETVACQLEGVSDYQKNQYKAVRVSYGLDEKEGLTIGAKFLVYWEGDLGCAGGSGTITPNFSVVEQSGFSSAQPIIQTGYKFPELDLVRLTSLTAKNGIVSIKGITYGANDQQGDPKKVVAYNIKFDEAQGGFIRLK